MAESMTIKGVQAKVIAMAPNSWNGPWMNRQQLLSRLGYKHEILYTSGLWTIWDRDEPAWEEAPIFGRTHRQDHVLVDKPSKVLLRWPSNTFIDRMAISVVVRRWKKAIKADNLKPLIAYLFHPQYYPYISVLKPDYIIYHAYDMLSMTPGWNKELDDFQKKLLEKADLVIASSKEIADELESLSEKSVEILPNAADFTAFSKVLEGEDNEPTDLKNIPHPRIGYVGNLNLKVDFSIIANLSHRQPEWQFVIVGGEGKFDDYTRQELERCKAQKNVHFLGAKHYQEIPYYICHMDVNLMNYRIDGGTWARGIYPLKLHEYLASGLPIVSAEIPSVVPFADQVAIAHNQDQWELLVDEAVRGICVGDYDSRRRVARENSWDSRALRLNRFVQAIIGGFKKDGP